MTKANREKMETQARRNAALADLIETAGGYFTATPAQIAAIAERHDMECWDVEGMYFDAGEKAGEE